MLVSPLHPSFLGSCSLSSSSLKRKALCIVMSFLVLWLICWSSSPVHFKKGPEYLTWDSAQMSIPLMIFLQCSLVSNSFLALQRVFFLIFVFHPRLFDGARFKYYQVLISSFFLSVLIFPWFSSIITSTDDKEGWRERDRDTRADGSTWCWWWLLPWFVVFCSLLFAWHIFLCQIPTLYRHSISSLPVTEFPILFHFWQIVVVYVH